MESIIQEICHHCHTPITETKAQLSDYVFCCLGCKNVYQLLSDNDLCEYYALDQNAGIRINESVNTNKFDYLNEDKYRDKFVRFSDNNKTHVLFTVPQMHCRSCLWLLEKLYKINSYIYSSQVYFDKKEVYIVFDESKLSLSKLVALISSLGYEPSLNFENVSERDIIKQRNTILKIGVSGFCFANIMMLSLPDYFAVGMIEEIGFRSAIPIVNTILSLPVLYVAFKDFFIPAWIGIKKGLVNIDFPVSVAILVTYARSLYEIYYHISNGYLDSMSGIVFFMLIGRWLQNRTENFLNFSRNYLSYFPLAVERIVNGQSKQTAIQELNIHDTIRIYHNEIIPVDSILSKGDAMIDYSFVNGENSPVYVEKGSHLYAGGRQLHGVIELIVMNQYNQSHLTSLWNHFAFQKDKLEQKQEWTDKIGMYFTYIVLALSAVSGLYWYSMEEYSRMWNAISTTLIVACPCALLLASGFTYGHALRVLGKYKFYVRHFSILDKIKNISHIIFDKTGTITYTHQQKIFYEGETLKAGEIKAVASLLAQSKHPHAMSICHYLGGNIPLESISFKETIGKGIEGWIDEQYIKIGSDEFCGINSDFNKTHVNICVDNHWKGRYIIMNAYRNGISKLFNSIQNKFKTTILSGDKDGEYETLREYIHADNSILFHQSPLDKLKYVENLEKNGERTMMIGDGLNDSGAFQASSVAVALTEKNNFFNPSSDIILDSEKLIYLENFIAFIHSSKTIIYFMFAYSILYNIIGLSYALRGDLTPVIAAILMPISSVSLILLIYFSIHLSEKKYLIPHIIMN